MHTPNYTNPMSYSKMSHQSSFLFVFTRLVFLCCFVFSGCQGDSSRSLAEEMKDIRFTLRGLRAVEDRLVALEQDVKALQGMLSRSKMAEPPLTSTTLISDGSHLDDPFLGPKDAQIVVMAFTDYQCKPCRRFYSSTFPQLKKDFIDTKRIKFILRDFPLRSNPYAQKAATYAHCAGEQGKYWEVSQAFFEGASDVDAGLFEPLIGSISGLKLESLRLCVESGRYNKEISRDTKAALQLGAKGAPSFFVGTESHRNSFEGVFIRGAQPFPVLAAEIDRQLAKEITTSSGDAR